MSERQVTICQSCEAPMRWVKTRKGKNMPIDDAPASDGRFVIQPDTDPPRVRFLSEEDAAAYEGDKFTSHFQTCDNPGRFSKKGKS